jgi:Leucine-rich repeat (LRR) protein
MKAILRARTALLVFLAGGAAHADICDRTPEIVAAVEYYMGMRCENMGPDELRQIRDMYVPSKGIFALQEGDLSGMLRIEYLSLYGNKLIGLPGRVFRGLGNVYELDLSNNQLRSLPKGLFQGMPYLEYLSLQENQLTTLPVGIFDGLDNVESLSLAKNQLSSVPEGLFSGLKGLEYLELSGNPLTPKDLDQIRSEVPEDCYIYF